jgi:rhodanese-related sulfurtransferase
MWEAGDGQINMNDKVDFIEAYGDFFTKNFNVEFEEILNLYDQSKYFGYPQEPGGSVWTSEGRSIYVLIRLLKPKRILEIGNYLGRSSNFILKAVEDNGEGDVVLLDIMERLEYEKLHSRNFARVLDDSLKWLDKPLDFDLFVVDGCHEYAHVKKEMQIILKNSTQPIWVWSHDYYTVRPPQCEVGRALDEIRNEYSDRLKIFEPMIEQTSNCGIAIMKYE